MAETLLVRPATPNAMPVTVAAARPTISISRRTRSCCIALLITVTRPWAPIKTASEGSAPGRCLISASIPGRERSRGFKGLSRTIITTGIIAISSSIPPPRKTRRSPNCAAASPPTTGPIALPSATADVTTPSDHPTRWRGVSTATRAVAADSPEGAGNRHRQPGHAAGGGRPEVEVMSLRHAEVLRDEDRKEWKSEAETEDGGELGEPQRDQVSPPIDRVRWGHPSLSRAISRITGSGLEQASTPRRFRRGRLAQLEERQLD